MSMMPSQQMRLEQRLTPQLIQSMEILTLPLMALEARVREELESNPVLELLEPESGADSTASPKEDLPATETNLAEAESFERLERMTRELELDPGDLPFGRTGSAVPAASATPSSTRWPIRPRARRPCGISCRASGRSWKCPKRCAGRGRC